VHFSFLGLNEVRQGRGATRPTPAPVRELKDQPVFYSIFP
jgi:hypothetical protein